MKKITRVGGGIFLLEESSINSTPPYVASPSSNCVGSTFLLELIWETQTQLVNLAHKCTYKISIFTFYYEV